LVPVPESVPPDETVSEPPVTLPLAVMSSAPFTMSRDGTLRVVATRGKGLLRIRLEPLFTNQNWLAGPAWVTPVEVMVPELLNVCGLTPLKTIMDVESVPVLGQLSVAPAAMVKLPPT
jgi:hypothetical protein